MMTQENDNIKLKRNNLNEKQPIIKTIIILVIFLLIGTCGYITTNKELGLLIVMFFIGFGIYILPIIILAIWIIYYIKLSIRENKINKKIFYKPIIIAIISSALCYLSMLLISEIHNKINVKNKSDELSLPKFVDKRFYRKITGCGENIGFNSNYKMYYYEDCGNPVDAFDMCEDYKVNKTKNEIIVYCDGFQEHFKIIEYTPGKQLILERNNETLIFEEERQ